MKTKLLQVTSGELSEIIEGDYSSRFKLITTNLPKGVELDEWTKNADTFKGCYFQDLETKDFYYIRYYINASYGYDFPECLTEHENLEIVYSSAITPEIKEVKKESIPKEEPLTGFNKEKKELLEVYKSINPAELRDFFVAYDDIDKMELDNALMTIKNNLLTSFNHFDVLVLNLCTKYKIDTVSCGKYLQNPSAYKLKLKRRNSIYPYIYQSTVNEEVSFHFSNTLNLTIGNYLDTKLFYFNENMKMITNMFGIDTDKGFKTVETAFKYAYKQIRKFTKEMNREFCQKEYEDICTIVFKEFEEKIKVLKS